MIDAWLPEQTNDQELVYQVDTYHFEQEARVLEIQGNCVRLDKVIFYPLGGGQAGDHGMLDCDGVETVKVKNTTRDESGIWLHCVADQLVPGMQVKSTLDIDRRLAHARLHTALHLLCIVFSYPVTGCRIDGKRATIDMNFGESTPSPRDVIQDKLKTLISDDHSICLGSIDRAAGHHADHLQTLVRLASKLPSHLGPKLRIVTIGDGLDHQFCGGTHVRSTAEVGDIVVTKVENKGKRNRRIVLNLNG